MKHHKRYGYKEKSVNNKSSMGRFLVGAVLAVALSSGLVACKKKEGTPSGGTQLGAVPSMQKAG
jgi:hypothetical protein